MCLATWQEGQQRTGGACGRGAAAGTEDRHPGKWELRMLERAVGALSWWGVQFPGRHDCLVVVDPGRADVLVVMVVCSS